jgi:hypothetical protein
VLPFGSALLARHSRRHLRQSPDRDGKGEHPHRYSVHGSHLLGRCHGQLQATSPSITRPILSQPRDHDSERARAVAGRIRRGGPAGPVTVDDLILAAPRRTGSRKALRAGTGGARRARGPTSRVTGRPARLLCTVGQRLETGAGLALFPRYLIKRSDNYHLHAETVILSWKLQPSVDSQNCFVRPLKRAGRMTSFSSGFAFQGRSSLRERRR